MSTRKSISPKVRFDIFKRDKFTCQYCGSVPPSVILHIDHIIPVSKGGTNITSNLISACDKCNLGKGAGLLDVPITKEHVMTIKEIRERKKQLKEYHELKLQEQMRRDEETEAVLEAYLEGFPNKTYQSTYSYSIKKFLKELGYDEVMEAMGIAVSKSASRTNRFKYFCGICWNKIKEAENARS